MAKETEFAAKADALMLNTVHEVDGAKFIALPEGATVNGLESFQEHPNYVDQRCVFSEPASLAAYVNAFDAGHTHVLASSGAAKISASLDYHHEGSGEEVIAAHNQHHAIYVAQKSEIYQAWDDFCGKYRSQKEAGEFLEDRAADVVAPESADIMEMVMNFEALKKVDFKSSQRLRDGMRQFLYHEEDQARGSLTIPEEIIILAPVFQGMEPQRIKVRIRFRLTEGRLHFAFLIADKEQVEREAFERCVDAFKSGLKRDIFIYRSA